MYSLLFGKLPFNGSSNSEVIKSITKHPVKFPKSIHVSDEARNLIHRMLEKDPARRIRMLDIQLHPWFALDEEEIKAKTQKVEKARLLSFDLNGLKLSSDPMTPVGKDILQEDKKSIEDDQYESTPPFAGDKKSFGRVIAEVRFKDRKKPPLPPAAAGRNNPRILKHGITKDYGSERFLPIKNAKFLHKNLVKKPHFRSQSNLAKSKLRASYDGGHMGIGFGTKGELLSVSPEENGKKLSKTPKSEAEL